MKPWFISVSEHVSVMLNLAALLIVVIGSVEVLISMPRLFLRSTHEAETRTRIAWLRFGHWLVAALTFQLGSDIVESAVTRSWQEIGRLAAVAGVRTFLNYFLDRDLSTVAERLRGAREAPPAS